MEETRVISTGATPVTARSAISRVNGAADAVVASCTGGATGGLGAGPAHPATSAARSNRRSTIVG
ncbi:MAG: hypothetical protein HZB20_08160 [Chloroflexi bacterium]|nr:hypothetical protein [Chloroflexota bacterium]